MTNNINTVFKHTLLATLLASLGCQEYEIEEIKTEVTPGPLIVAIEDPNDDFPFHKNFDIPEDPWDLGDPLYPDIDLSFTQHDFGTLELGDVSSPQNLQVSNTGDYKLDISKVEKNCTSTSYVVSNLQNSVIYPGASETLAIEYHPSVYGDDACYLNFHSNDPDEPVVSVLLAGRAGVPVLEIDPPSLNFKDLDMVLTPSITDSVSLKNVGDGTLEISKIEKVYGNNDIILGSFPNSKILPGQQELLDVIYHPSSSGQGDEKVKITTNDPADPVQRIKIKGNTADPDIDSVAGLDFGIVDVGKTVTEAVEIHNLGKGTLQVNGIYFTNSTNTFSIAKGFTGNIPAGSHEKIEIEYTPDDHLSDTSGIQIISNDPIDPIHLVSLDGDVTIPIIEVDPLVIDFGTVDVHGPSPVETIRVSNVGQGSLDITSISLKYGSVYSLANNTSTQLTAGQYLDFDITYAPTHHNYDFEEVEIKSSDPATPLTIVTIEGVGAAPQVVVDPDPYDFGANYLECFSEQSFDVKNIGDTDLEITNIEYYTSFPNHYTIDYDHASNGNFPWTIAPGMFNTVYVSYEPYDVTVDTSFLKIHSNDPLNPIFLAHQFGEGDYYATVTDTFQQSNVLETDILFVVDNSCSMGTWQQHVADNFDAFINVFQNSGVDYRIAVITTDDPDFAGPYIDNSSADPVSELNNQVSQLGTYGSGYELGLEMAMLSVGPGGDASPGAGFERHAAKMALIFVSDEPDGSMFNYGYGPTYLNPLDYVPHYEAVKVTQDRIVAHAIGGDYPSGCGLNGAYAMGGKGYYEVVADMGGTFLSICDVDWGIKMETIAKDSIIKSGFELSDIAIANTIEVTVDSTPSANWVYDSVNNTVVFNGGHIPAIGSVIEITYNILGGC